MASSLDDLVEQGVLSEVVARLKSGKEADVYTVRYAGKVVAAKVYKDRSQRSFKNNAAYKDGRSVRNSRSQRAIDKGSKFGKDAAEDAWKATEVATLYKLHAAGVRTPEPILFIDGVLLMEVVRGEDGETAPRLIDIDLTEEQATAGYHDMLTQLVRILSCDLIHGDLSPYNVLWGAKGPTIIDFPQAISAAHNNSSEAFFLRDARNILDHFVSIAPSLRARSGDAREIWRAYVRRELTSDFVPTGRPASPEPRRESAPAAQRERREVQAPRGPRPPSQQRAVQSEQSQQRAPQEHQRGQRQQRGPQEHQRGQHQPRAPQEHQRGQRPPEHQRGQRPPEHQRLPEHQRGQRSPDHQREQRSPDHQRGQRPPEHQRGQPQQHRTQPHQQRGAEQQPRQHREEPPRAPRQQRGPDPQRAPQQRPPGRPRTPEVIVMTRRPRPADEMPATVQAGEPRNARRRERP